MNILSVMSLLSGLAIAGGSAYVAKDYIENQTAVPAAGGPQMVEVAVAAQDIPFGTAIEAQALTTIAWPADALPNGTFSGYGNLLPQLNGEPRRARRAISQGELILASKVSGFGEKVTIVQTLKRNHRAMAIKVNAETGVGGFVTPGDHVDILLTQGRGTGLKTVTIIQNTRVIGVDQEADIEKDMPGVARTVTVEVTPAQGQRLALAQKAGTLSLTLRTVDANEKDEPLESIGLKDILQERSPVPEQHKAKTVLIRRGTEISVTELR